jgi:hypothetical protein
MIKKLKEKLGSIRLNRDLKGQQRSKSFINIQDAKSIGIVFDATNLADLETVKKYVISLKEKGKRVHAIGYFNQKITPANISYPKTEFDFFNDKELTKLNQPASPYIQTFISEIRDIMIDLNIFNKFPLRYIVANSYAKCKIGIERPENKNLHDILISMKPEDGLKNYIVQLDKYLDMINKQ